MSLINDALKRVGRAQQQQPTGPAPIIGLKPVEEDEAPAGGRTKLLLAVLVVALLGAGGWFAWNAFRPGKAKPASSAQQAKKTGVVEVAKTQPGPQATGAVAKATSGPQANLPAASTPAPAAAAGAKPAQPTVATVKQPVAGTLPGGVPDAALQPATQAQWPKLDLQGIFFRLKNPSARINGTNLYIGNEIQGVRLVGIERYSVILQLGTETNVLTLGQ